MQNGYLSWTSSPQMRRIDLGRVVATPETLPLPVVLLPEGFSPRLPSPDPCRPPLCTPLRAFHGQMDACRIILPENLPRPPCRVRELMEDEDPEFVVRPCLRHRVLSPIPERDDEDATVAPTD